ncbi:hypothetical protein K505DRAFT_417805 [Melanomma pulvis-pyrius CBS 109.77]|uniref:Ubiquitin 3 binding protein But2 C-terminal domain-containing protein n=1 Tax=Melanomma pulvis-pyrius CBS 109.77 TaxID=1314802 RepID=A0A6A6XA52_9PLEO|nr:hypothetical protein K505DRAFT_417805 [Melanomma pulvis-pyrius CBS 109.77]
MYLNWERVLAFAPSVLLATPVNAILSHPQGVLAEAVLPKVGVPGRNSAYFTRVVQEGNEHVMVYLYGHISYPLPGLSDATLSISGFCPDHYTIGSEKLTDWITPVVRHGRHYGGPLGVGPNEVLCDQLMLLWPPFEDGKWNCSVEVTARLPEPDARVLFSFAQNFTLQWPKEDEKFVLDAESMEEMGQGNLSSLLLR